MHKRRSAVIYGVLGMLSVIALAAPDFGQTRTVQYQHLPGRAMVYSNGYLFSWDNPKFSEVTVYGRDAKPAYSVTEHKDGVYHHSWAIDSDGLAASVYNVRGAWEGRVDLFDPTGKLALSFSTRSYVPQHIVFAPDHTIWTAGFPGGNDGSGGEFNVLHHYGRDGKELGEALPWSQIAGSNNTYTALQPLIGAKRLFVAKDRIGFMSLSGAGEATWIEVSFSGDLLGKYDLSNRGIGGYFPTAMSDSGDVYAALSYQQQFQGWAVLDRSEGVWRRLTAVPSGRIVGSEADNIVFANCNGASATLDFVSSKSLALKTIQQYSAALK